MVTKKRTAAVKRTGARQPYRPARRDADGTWLCNVVDSCSSAAVLQASPETLPACAGCDVAGGALKANVDMRQAELDAANAREEAIRVAASSRADDSGDDPYTPFDHLELHVIAERRRLLGAEIEGLAAEHTRVVDEHTHPLFACDKHTSKLPK